LDALVACAHQETGRALLDGPVGSAGSLGSPLRNYSPPALFSSTARERYGAGANLFGDRHLYASVIAVECATSTRDEMVAKPPDAGEVDAPEIAISMHLS
jgi:hypothetical protein